MDTIVVGVDGSEPSRRALAFAAEEAHLRDARLRVVCAWQVPPAAYGGFTPAVDQSVLDAFRENAENVVRDAVEIVGKLHAELRVATRTPEGNAAERLLEEAAQADLLVVGNRGHGDVSSLILGSISHQVVHRASCPVVVVPHERHGEHPAE